MTDTIEQKALALVNEVRAESRGSCADRQHLRHADMEELEAALRRAIEQHEAFRQEVSDAVKDTKFMVETHCDTEALVLVSNRLNRFITAKPDPLVEAIDEVDTGPIWDGTQDYANKIRAAIEKRGGKIVWGEG